MNPVERHIALLANPSDAGDRARELARSIGRLLSDAGVASTEHAHPWPVTLDNYTDVWIVGGDGTLNHFINRFPECSLPLGIFAGGSGNDFHWMLHGDMAVEDQVHRMLNGSVKPVDAGTCNGKLFLNGVGIGFDGAIVHQLLQRRKLAGKASYLLAILKMVAGYREKWARIEWPGGSAEGDHLMISIANGKRYGGGFQVAPEADLADGLLDLGMVGSISPFSRIRYLPVIEKGEHLRLPFVRYAQSETVTVRTSEPVHAHLDGEYFLADTFTIRILPAHFRFLV